MAGTPEVPPVVHDELVNLAKKHSRFVTFAEDLARLAENAWHRARSEGVAGSETDEDTSTPADDGELEDAAAKDETETETSDPAPVA